MGRLQLSPKFLVLTFMERNVRILERRLLRPSNLPGHQVGNEWQTHIRVQSEKVCLDLTRAHQMNAGKQNSIHVKEWFHPSRRILENYLPLGFGEAEVVVRVVFGDDPTVGAVAGDFLQLPVYRRRMHHQRREKLLQHVAVLLEEQLEELPHIMADYIHLQAFDNASVLDRFIANFQPDHTFKGQHMRSAHIEIRIRRGKAVEVRAADGSEQQRVWLGSYDAVKTWVNGHVNLTDAAVSRRALMRKRFAAS